MGILNKIVIVLVVIWFSPLLAQDYDDMRVPGVSYDPSIPTPDEFLKHRLGEKPIRHHMLVDYMETLAASSDRINVEIIGYSHERRPILFLTITSPENHARIVEIRASHLALTDPSENEPISDDMPVVTWLNYGVHGAEASGMDASLPTVYHLAAARGAAIEEKLRNSVILVTAIFNPDGHSRRAAWVDMYGTNVNNRDGNHKQHNAAWPGDRTNHYWFDLNRQWLLQQHPEPQAWMSKWHEWRPNLSVDYHEMGTEGSYYFHPGEVKRTNPNVPVEAIQLMNEYSEYSYEVLDSEGKQYYNEEGYDNFYIGKGSTYPLVNGGVGILYEAGAARAREIDTTSGVKSYRDNILKHFRTSIASIDAGVGLRGKLLSYQQRFYKDAVADASVNALKAYVFASPDDPAKMFHFMELLNRHRVEVRTLERNITAGGKTFIAGESYLVLLAQPQYRLIMAMFERQTKFEDNTFYDVSAWTLPLSFDLDYTPLRGRQFLPDLSGDIVLPIMPEFVAPDLSNFGYTFRWTDYYSPKALNRVLSAGIYAKVATKSQNFNTTKGNVILPRGSIFVPLEMQVRSSEEIYDIMSMVSTEDGIEVHAVTSGNAISGPDFGSRSSQSLKVPKALLVTGQGVAVSDAGEVWHLLDYRMDMPLTLMDKAALGGADWSKYTHLILVDGNYNSIKDPLAKRIALWVNEGGTIIGLKRGALWADKKVLNYPRLDKEETKMSQGGRLDYDVKAITEAEKVVGGAIYASDLDISHPMAFGYLSRDLASHKNSKIIFDIPKNPWGSVAKYTDAPLLTGYSSEENQKSFAGTPMMIAERKGQGSVIMFADNVNFRAIWYGTNKLFLNGLFFSKAFQRPRGN
ncbi:MAG: M14 family zinc carboxypeptidase [Sphingomonadales bacterium]